MTEKIEKYFDRIVRVLELHPLIENVAVEKKVTTRNRGYIKGMVTFTNGKVASKPNLCLLPLLF